MYAQVYECTCALKEIFKDKMYTVIEVDNNNNSTHKHTK